MTNHDPETLDTAAKKSWRDRLPRFGIGTLMIAVVVISVMATATHYMVRGVIHAGNKEYEGVSPILVFMLFTLAAPMFLMVAISLLRLVIIRLNRRQ